MASFAIEIPDDQVDRIITAVCANYNYNSQIANPDFDPALEDREGEDYDPATNPETLDNPEIPTQFTNRMVREYLQNNTTAYEIQVAKAQVQAQAALAPTITDPAI